MRDTMMTTRATTPAGRSPRFEMRWVPVTDASGRTHLESRWIDLEAVPAPATSAVPAA